MSGHGQGSPHSAVMTYLIITQNLIIYTNIYRTTKTGKERNRKEWRKKYLRGENLKV